MTYRVVEIRIQNMERRVLYGLPLTIDEQRWLFEQACHKLGPVLKRCYACNETGRKRKLVPDGFSDQGNLVDLGPCPACKGTARIPEEITYTVTCFEGIPIRNSGKRQCSTGDSLGGGEHG